MITRLDAASARKISAGQVITDLSSVIKELLENALDAGAHIVNIRLYRFGLDKIVVEDDGEGIPMPGVVDATSGCVLSGAETPLLKTRATTKRGREEMEENAATSGDSKGSDEESPLGTDSDRRADPSLGFRGEALHSLAQVSKVTVETMHAVQAPYTVKIAYDSSIHETHLSASTTRQSPGTTVTAEALFKQLPVRLKEFTKNQRKQLLHATNLVRQYSVSHPRLRLVFSHQEHPQGALVTLVSLTGSNDLQRSVTEAYGGLCLSHMTRVDWQCSFGAVNGFVSHVNGGGRMSADRQVFSLDGRLVDLPRLAAAVNDAFGQCLPNAHQRQSVAFFLRISTTDSVGYDVNLTPNKRKVIIGHEEKLAEEMHAAALKEFRAASEGIDMEKNVQRRGSGNDKDVSKEVRLPVSATAFTQFTFRRSEGAELMATQGTSGSSDTGVSAVAKGLSTIDLRRLGSALYSNDNGGTSVEEVGAEAILEGSLFPSSESTSSTEEDEDASSSQTSGETERKRPRPSASSGMQGVSSGSSDDEAADLATTSQKRRLEEGPIGCGPGEGNQLGDTEEELPVVELSDQGNQKRDESARVTVPVPSWERLITTAVSGDHEQGCGCWCDAMVCEEQHAGRHKKEMERCRTGCGEGRGFSAFLQQSGKELTAYFHKRSFRDMTVLGQFNHGFIIAALGDDLFVIDQHASDEKYNYERLMRAYQARPQPLVQPVAVPMDAEEVELAVEHATDLMRHGFTVKRGDDPTKLLVSSVPVLPYDVVSAADVLELVQQLVRYGAITRQLRAVWHSLATKACRTSIMIGTALPESTMSTIVRRLSELDQPWTCPHGRPTLRHLGNAKAFHMGEAKPSALTQVGSK